jgi:glutathione S-transferase
MLTLVSYPGLFGTADNNPFGLKVFAFLRLAGLPFRQEHALSAAAAPRGQLPFLREEDGSVLGDSDAIVAHLTARHGIGMDQGLEPAQRVLDVLVRRTLDDLYWVMSYSRWKDDRFWPAFRQAMLEAMPGTEQALEEARAYNATRYHHQGIGRYAPEEAYARGVASLDALAALAPEAGGFLFGPEPCSTDAALYGFVANIWLYPIETPLRAFIGSRPRLAAHCEAMHARVGGAA